MLEIMYIMNNDNWVESGALNLRKTIKRTNQDSYLFDLQNRRYECMVTIA